MSETIISQENPEHNITIDTSNAVIFSDYTDTDALVLQEQDKPGYNEIGLDDPAAVATLGILAIVSIVPVFLHARHDRIRRENQEHDAGKE
jgi:hypothetical protein